MSRSSKAQDIRDRGAKDERQRIGNANQTRSAVSAVVGQDDSWLASTMTSGFDLDVVLLAVSTIQFICINGIVISNGPKGILKVTSLTTGDSGEWTGRARNSPSGRTGGGPVRLKPESHQVSMG